MGHRENGEECQEDEQDEEFHSRSTFCARTGTVNEGANGEVIISRQFLSGDPGRIPGLLCFAVPSG
jgi:NADPH-dependent curcumin reductase CurA